jgi:hypothetical protein
MLIQRGMTPVQSTNPRSPVSWTQGLAQMIAAYKGGQGLQEVEQGQAALGQQYQKGLADEVKRISELRQGRTILPDPQEVEQSADQGTPEPRVGSTGDPRAAVMAALTSSYGPVREMGKLDFQGDLKERENAAARLARLEERSLILDANARNEQLDRESKERIANENNAVKQEIAELKSFMQGGGASPYFTPVYTPQGVMAFDNRKGSMAPLSVNGQPVVRSADDPNLQGRLAGAKAKGKATAEREFNMAGIGGVIKQAEDLLTGEVKPTGSGVGSLVDTVGGFFGMSPSGAKEAQTLKSVAGALTSKMPRMEGPQSDRDTQLYREMAAEVGNDTVPVARRVAALQAVKNLWLKYEKQNPDAFGGGGARGAPSGVDPAVWDAMTDEERALWPAE